MREWTNVDECGRLVGERERCMDDRWARRTREGGDKGRVCTTGLAIVARSVGDWFSRPSLAQNRLQPLTCNRFDDCRASEG